MPTLRDYNRFEGLHPEMGTISNVLAHQGVVAPHTEEAFTEAMLLGISGGVSVLYFTFDYEGYEPHVYIGTHLASPTDKPMEAVLERLGVKGHVRETTSRDRARANLIEALEEGRPVIAWAGQRGLSYNAMPSGADPGMMPLVVYGYELDVGGVYIADRSRLPLAAGTDEFEVARAVQGSLKNRSLTLEAPPRLKNLHVAIEAGIRRCARVMLEGPEKGPRANFGLAALRKWAGLVVDTRSPKGWLGTFAPGPHLYSAFTSCFEWIELRSSGAGAGRAMYGDFLTEAAPVLHKPHLEEAAALYRESASRWTSLARAMLPVEIPALKETRELLERKHRLFIEQGMDTLMERREIARRLEALKVEAATTFPTAENELVPFLAEIRDHILAVHDAEKAAVEAMHRAMG
ncbi:MAG TPA: BtrH N-terminal domain-containing protein [Chloroflexia bacterium]|jgi:hypothetical protein